MGGTKATCTPEQWEARKAYARAYSKSPVGRAKDKARYTEKRKNQITANARRRKYGVTDADVERLMAIQGGACGICLTPFVLDGVARRFQHVDHCHDGRHVRGLLCARCNVAEGFIRALGISPEQFAKQMQAYLDNPPSKQETLW